MVLQTFIPGGYEFFVVFLFFPWVAKLLSPKVSTPSGIKKAICTIISLLT